MFSIRRFAFIFFITGLIETRTVKKLSFEFGGENEMDIGVLEALKGFGDLLSDTVNFTRNSEEHTTKAVEIPKPTIDYSNRVPVVEEKIEKVTAFVLCVVGDQYNCGDNLGDNIDIIKHLGPPTSTTATGDEESVTGTSILADGETAVTNGNGDDIETTTSMNSLDNYDETVNNIKNEMYANPDLTEQYSSNKLNNNDDDQVVERDVDDQNGSTPVEDAVTEASKVNTEESPKNITDSDGPTKRSPTEEGSDSSDYENGASDDTGETDEQSSEEDDD